MVKVRKVKGKRMYKLNNEIKKENYTLLYFIFINLLKPNLII